MTVEERIRLIIGDMVITNASLTAQLEAAQAELKALKDKPLCTCADGAPQ